MRWDIFCKVIDNHGDAGVCWRLARQLAGECGQTVRLWIDAPAALAPLLGRATLPEQAIVDHVELRRWTPGVTPDIVADVIVEAFACELPESCIAAMATKNPPPRWVNLEYLSAEDWIEDCHGLPSPHPRLPLVKRFYFPGFSLQTGGLLRERTIPLPPSSRVDLARLIGQNRSDLPADALVCSLFCYDTAPLAPLLSAWENDPFPLVCLVPPGKPREALRQALAANAAPLKNTRFLPLPFLPQPDYDRLLSACDFNFVRGEDSFVRAQWAAKPLIWQIYPQADNAHCAKLAAFLRRYTATMPDAERQLLASFWQSWNADGKELFHLWPHFRTALLQLTRHAESWRSELLSQSSLVERLLLFCGFDASERAPV